MPKPRRRIELAFTTSVEVIETTAGATRDAMSANEGTLTAVTVADPELVWIGADCAFDLRIRPRSALITMPNAAEAMMIATVDKMRFVREFMIACSSFGVGT
jgi:hypothetical protein